MIRTNRLAYTEAEIQKAILAHQNHEFTSLLAAAQAFNIPYSTLKHRVAGRTTRQKAHEDTQNLTDAEEKSLVKLITRLTTTGFPIAPGLMVELAEFIRARRVVLSKSDSAPSLKTKRFGENWLKRFKTRNLEIESIWTRQIDRARFSGANYEVVSLWFNAVTTIRVEYQYAPNRIYNMDESGCAIGTSQSSRVLVNARELSTWKAIPGRQEWVTTIECINATGEALPPLLIFKAKHANSSWIPKTIAKNWRISTSNSGWTSDSHGFEWLKEVFEPETRPAIRSQRRLLIMDGHSSHITARVIQFCIDKAIDLLIMPPHCSHILQPLDVSVFAPFKRALAAETDTLSRAEISRLQRVEWLEMFIRARAKAITSKNIKSGWRATGLEPLSPIVVLSKLKSTQPLEQTEPATPLGQIDLNLAFLDSSPPDGTELQQANSVLNSTLQTCTNVPSPVRRYVKRVTSSLETKHSELLLVKRQNEELKALLGARRIQKKGKRIALKGQFVFSTAEVLKIAKQAEAETAAKKARKQPQKRKIEEAFEEDELEEPNEDSTDSELSCIVVASRS